MRAGLVCSSVTNCAGERRSVCLRQQQMVWRYLAGDSQPAGFG
ncbi:MAG: hypothetical protein RLY92_1464, partial [Chloroflexota bacterium]